MESSRILVTGLPEGTTETDLIIYFQSPRDSGGGDVKKIEIEGGQAIITFEDVQAASRVVGKRKHRLKSKPLIVSLLSEEAAESCSEDELDETFTSDQMEGVRHGVSHSELRNNQLCNENGNQYPEAGAKQELTMQREVRERCLPPRCKVKVTGLSQDTSEDLLTYYFENARRSKGGPISAIDVDRDLRECSITFKSPEDAARIIEHSPHKVNGLSLDVSFPEEEVQNGALNTEQAQSVDEESIAIIVSGDLPSEDALRYYFENARRSGGGEVITMDCNDEGNAVITFHDVEDLKRLLEGPHCIDKKPLTVTKQPPKKKVPLDPLKVHVQGLDEKTSKDSLWFYLEKFSTVDVSEVYEGCNNNALVVFSLEPDFTTLFEKVSKDRRGLEGKHPRLERVAICNCIQVKGLKKETSDDTIELYFENNKRSGGGNVSNVERIERDQALVYFEDPCSIETVIQKSHVLERQTLHVIPYYPFLESSTTNKTDVVFDAEVYDYIKKNHQEELNRVLDEKKVLVKLSDDFQSSTITILPSEKKKDSPQSWQKRVNGLESFLKKFKKIKILIGAELFDEIIRRWKEQNDLNRQQQGSSRHAVLFNKQSRCVQIIGREKDVDEEYLRIQQLIDAAKRDTELMKSIVEVDITDIVNSRLALLKMCGIGERLQNKHKHLTISIDLKGNKLHLKGPRNILQEVQLEIYKFSSNAKEESDELPTNVIAVLKKPPVSDFLTSLLKERGIKALFVYDHNKSSNEVLVVGAGSDSVGDAKGVLQNAIQELSLKLTDENTLVLESRQWIDFQSNLTSTNKIGIFVDPYSSTLWVCGIAKDVQSSFGRVRQFLEQNTILHDTFTADQGTTRFMLEKWGSKLDKIKKDLSTCCVDLRVAHDYEGIEVSGTAEGLTKCIKNLEELGNVIQKESISIDKPGMKKFILQEKGSKSLQAIEKSNNCVILTLERNDHGMSFTDLEDVGKSDDVISSAQFMCSYLTIQGKKVSVFKGDITRHRVDAIVNAANSQLDHIGGLALAIVKAGGMEIQRECHNYIREKGDLLEGRAMVTTAGALPCNKVIHTVGPKWDPGESLDKKEKKKRLLRYSIMNCLKEATASRSIAIPAVSSGVYGFPREQCAEIIVDAVLDFCAGNPSCPLTEIHLVNNDDPTVKVFLEEMRKRFSGKTTFTDSEKPKMLASGIRSSGSAPKAKLKKKPTLGRIHITVKVGDLAKEQAHVLVGTAGSDLNLNNNPCARALSEAAGQSLQQQCAKHRPVAAGDIAVLSQTGKLACQSVVFAVCSHWNNGRGKEVLRNIIKKCLQEADKKGMKSIAFAAIGTGVLQFPRDQVADLYFDEVTSYDRKNPKTSLRDVRFVLYHNDAATIQAFKAEELTRQAGGLSEVSSSKSTKNSVITSSSTGLLTFSPVKGRSPDQVETTIGPLCFQVQSGDITKETTEAIAVISNCDLDISASGAGAAILRSGGESIKRECSRHGPQTPGSVVVTKAGKLKARYLYHIVPTDQALNGLKTCILKCLKEAENNSVSSISFPAIGTGNIGISGKACAHLMLSAIQELSKEKPTSLKLIKMTIFQEGMINDVRSAMEEASGVKQSPEPASWRQTIGKGLKKVAGAFGFGSSYEDTILPESASSREFDNKEISLEITAGCKKDLEDASKAVNELMKEKCKQMVIENKAISNLTQEYMRKMHTFELRYNVELTLEREVERIVIDGQYEDVLQVIGEIHELLHEVERDKHERNHAEVLAKDIQWKYEENGTFEDYEGDLNAQIEVAYQKNESSIVIEMYEEVWYTIKFDVMKQVDDKGNATNIKRTDLRKDVELPHCWTTQPIDSSGKEATVHLVQLHPVTNAQEYKKVSDEFQKTCPNLIVKIERVQNPTLYGAYVVYKQKMDKTGDRGSNEMSLFHGTKGPNCNLINDKGFNRSFCGQNAAVHGNGVYFALQASYSARSTYSPPDASGNRYMYLAKVLVGEYTVGRQGILTPPVKSATNFTDTYDSVVDNVSNPGIFVVFYDWQCYPEYLITFQ